MTGFGNSRNGFVIGKSYTTPQGTFAVLEFREARMLVEFESGLRRELPIATRIAADQRRGLSGYGVDKDYGLAPLNIRMPDKESLRKLAAAWEDGGLHYYLETHAGNGQREPHLHCKPRAWEALRDTLLSVSKDCHEGIWAGSRSEDTVSKSAWETTRARNVYALLRAIGPHVSNDYRVAYYLKALEELWPILAEEHGGAYRS